MLPAPPGGVRHVPGSIKAFILDEVAVEAAFDPAAPTKVLPRPPAWTAPAGHGGS
jgi:hypothetical protein